MAIRRIRWQRVHGVRIAVLLLLIVVIAFAAHQTWATMQNRAGHTTDKQNFHIRYAKTYLEYTKANRSWAESINARVPNTIPIGVMEQYADEVAVAEKELAAAQKGSDHGRFGMFLSVARFGYRAAETEWRRAAEVRKRAPGAISKQEVERLRLLAELTKITLEQGETLVDASPEAQMAWKVSLTFDEMLRMRDRVRRLRAR